MWLLTAPLLVHVCNLRLMLLKDQAAQWYQNIDLHQEFLFEDQVYNAHLNILLQKPRARWSLISLFLNLIAKLVQMKLN